MKYDTALRPYVTKRLEEIGRADLVAGIPCYNNEATLPHVMQQVSRGIREHYGDRRAVILVADGGSTDDSRDAAKEFEIQPWQEKIVCIYRGPSGKGTALRAILEAADRLDAAACMVVDSDLRSITGAWVQSLLDPILNHGFDYVTPIYTRYKYDGTITNNIAYNLTRAVYGKRIRQPIGGDFAFSPACYRSFLSQNVWDTDVARFGIDIWMTTAAVIRGFRICQSHLGVKIHDAKDPASHLAAMFRQVVGTLFWTMEKYESVWKGIRRSEATPVFGRPGPERPEPIPVDLELLEARFRAGVRNFGSFYEKIFSAESFGMIRDAARAGDGPVAFETDAWVRILYELAATYHKWTHHRGRLLELAVPLYYGRVASFVHRTREMDSARAEELVEEQAVRFEENKELLLSLWDQPYEEDQVLNHRLREV